MEKESSVGSQVYSGLASFGKIKAGIGLVIGGLISLGLLAGGIYFLIESKKSTKTTAKVLEVSCGAYPQKGVYTCRVIYQYTVNGVEYKGEIVDYKSNYPLKAGDEIDIFYNNDNPNSSSASDHKTAGIIMTVFGGIMLIVLGANFYFTTKSEGYAAFTGVGSLFSGLGGSSSSSNSSSGSVTDIGKLFGVNINPNW